MAKKKYYAVKTQSSKKIYLSWDECKGAIEGISGAQYKGFVKKSEAEEWLYPNESKSLSGVRVYVDGSYQPSKSTRAGWGFVVITNGVVSHEGYGVTKGDALSRNIDGELRASLEAMKWAFETNQKIVLVHDYEGIARWALGDWKAKSQIAKLYIQAAQKWVHMVTFEKVAAHTGDVWNEYADKLAKKAIEEFIQKENQ